MSKFCIGRIYLYSVLKRTPVQTTRYIIILYNIAYVCTHNIDQCEDRSEWNLFLG